jgi:pyruvate dehydrogenase E2 component (dihydrolipoamide acetyltransferase)
MAEITMPRLSDTMEEGTIGKWLKQPGDAVEKGEIIAEIETDKATMELEAYESGTLQEILIQEGKTVAIGTTIATIGKGEAKPAAKEQADEPPPSAQAAEPAAPDARGNGRQQEPVASAQAEPPAPTHHGERVKASPLARRLASEYNIDLHQVQGSGPGGRIIKANVEAFRDQHGTAAPVAAQPAPSPAPAVSAMVSEAEQPAPEAVPLSRMRRAIATRMTEAKNGMPHFYVTSEIDMAEVLRLRKEINESNAVQAKISVNDMIVKAVARTLAAFPALNSSYVVGSDGQPGIVHHERINVNVAVAVEEGLIVPVVADADKKSLGTISAEIRDLAIRAREGKIKQHELEGGTFTVSNMGMFDVVDFIAIITPPQAGILAISSIRQVPLVRNSEIVVGDVMNVTLSADHRVTDGATGAQFLQKFKELMQAPMSLLV